jgi:broad specificity phosphatase PhoE
VKELADLLRVSPVEVIKELMKNGVMASVNQVVDYETAAIVAEALALPVEVEPLVRERRGFSCDVGTRKSVLRRRWPGLRLDHLDEEWWPHATESDAEVAARCARFRRLAAAWPDRERVLVVSHWGFILALVGRSLDNAEFAVFEP